MLSLDKKEGKFWNALRCSWIVNVATCELLMQSTRDKESWLGWACTAWKPNHPEQIKEYFGLIWAVNHSHRLIWAVPIN